ncbi:hypothetical protein D9611_011953 [Ephemerocybe angulata]|uniref:Uncharacterized protein n=1 Tax=Ephemerocybe angulata TaxID=980116 RepID=A0A8H5C500_9AGAR|nr:hypothetical protein D9611_011953 [Tulosesus angulatus]
MGTGEEEEENAEENEENEKNEEENMEEEEDKEDRDEHEDKDEDEHEDEDEPEVIVVSTSPLTSTLGWHLTSTRPNFMFPKATNW